MSSRKKREEIYINGKRVVGGIDAAKILTERASEMGSNRQYSRDTIYKRYTSGGLRPAVETPAGNLYYVDDIMTLPISPHLGAKGKQREHIAEDGATESSTTEDSKGDEIE